MLTIIFIFKIGDEDIIECDQQSNGSPCQTHEGGLHMPDSNSFKEFVISLRTRKRYNSQCTPEKSSSIGMFSCTIQFVLFNFPIYYLYWVI